MLTSPACPSLNTKACKVRVGPTTLTTQGHWATSGMVMLYLPVSDVVVEACAEPRHLAVTAALTMASPTAAEPLKLTGFAEAPPTCAPPTDAVVTVPPPPPPPPPPPQAASRQAAAVTLKRLTWPEILKGELAVIVLGCVIRFCASKV